MAPQHKIAHVCLTSCAIDRQGLPTILPSPTSALMTCPDICHPHRTCHATAYLPYLLSSCPQVHKSHPPALPQPSWAPQESAGNRRPLAAAACKPPATDRAPWGSLPRPRPSKRHLIRCPLRPSSAPAASRVDAASAYRLYLLRLAGAPLGVAALPPVRPNCLHLTHMTAAAAMAHVAATAKHVATAATTHVAVAAATGEGRDRAWRKRGLTHHHSS